MASGGDLAGSDNFMLAAADAWCPSHAKCAGYTADVACGAPTPASPTATYKDVVVLEGAVLGCSVRVMDKVQGVILGCTRV